MINLKFREGKGMRKLRLIQEIVPEIVSYYGPTNGYYGPTNGIMEPDYQCSCGMGISEEYKCCPYCGAELVWDKVRKPSKEFVKLLERL